MFAYADPLPYTDEQIAAVGCIVCGRPAELHHVRKFGQKRKSAPVIPLCPDHHRHGGRGVAVHAGKRTFEDAYGTEYELLTKTRNQLEG